MTLAAEVSKKALAGKEFEMMEFCFDNAFSISMHSDFQVVRFEDNSEVRIYISEDHEIDIIEQ